MNIRTIKEAIVTYYNPSGIERVGFILHDKIIEVENKHPQPELGFVIAPETVLDYTENLGAIATFHTHPGGNANLSVEDYTMFKMWNDLVHFIVGENEVRAYKANINNVILEIE